MPQISILSFPVRELIRKKEAASMCSCASVRIPIRHTISRSRDSGLRYNSPLSMEILNHTKQQYISQNYVIPRACAYTVCNMRQRGLQTGSSTNLFCAAFLIIYDLSNKMHHPLIYSNASEHNNIRYVMFKDKNFEKVTRKKIHINNCLLEKQYFCNYRQQHFCNYRQIQKSRSALHLQFYFIELVKQYINLLLKRNCLRNIFSDLINILSANIII